jgi:hypothetical protein
MGRDKTDAPPEPQNDFPPQGREMSLASDMKRCAQRPASACGQNRHCSSTSGFVDEVLKTLVKIGR